MIPFTLTQGLRNNTIHPIALWRRSMGIDPDLPQQEVQKRMGVPLFARTFGRYIGPFGQTVPCHQL